MRTSDEDRGHHPPILAANDLINPSAAVATRIVLKDRPQIGRARDPLA